jgi:hypothetical protein
MRWTLDLIVVAIGRILSEAFISKEETRYGSLEFIVVRACVLPRSLPEDPYFAVRASFLCGLII